MFTILTSFIKIPFINNLFNRLINKYTGSGIILILSVLGNLGVFPQDIVDKVDGIPANQLFLYLIIAVGIWLVYHMPKFKSKVKRLQEDVNILELKIKYKELTENLNKK